MEILLIISFIIILNLITILYQVKKELKFVNDTFHLKVLSKHIKLTREIEALTLLRNQTDFGRLDEIIQRLKAL